MPALRERFLAAIVAGDYAVALAAAQEACQEGYGVLYEEVVTPALCRVGELWQSGHLSVADEHVATAIAQSVLASFYSSFPWRPGGPKALVACVPGERHEVGARMAADLLALDGWNVRFVGADVPRAALVELAVRTAPRFVGLSISMVERLPSVKDAVLELRRVAPSAKVLVGGRAAATHPAIAAELGADLVAHSATSAVEMVKPWKR